MVRRTLRFLRAIPHLHYSSYVFIPECNQGASCVCALFSIPVRFFGHLVRALRKHEPQLHILQSEVGLDADVAPDTMRPLLDAHGVPVRRGKKFVYTTDGVRTTENSKMHQYRELTRMLNAGGIGISEWAFSLSNKDTARQAAALVATRESALLSLPYPAQIQSTRNTIFGQMTEQLLQVTPGKHADSAGRLRYHVSGVLDRDGKRVPGQRDDVALTVMFGAYWTQWFGCPTDMSQPPKKGTVCELPAEIRTYNPRAAGILRG